MAGLSDKYLSNIETARSIPSIDVLMRICGAISVTPDYLLTGTLIKENTELSGKIADKFKTLSDKQLTLLDSFIDWLVENEI
jgi:transcriptional regulator with XRE-family HTH domain